MLVNSLRQVLSFDLLCGGLPAPEFADNPLKYKFRYAGTVSSLLWEFLSQIGYILSFIKEAEEITVLYTVTKPNILHFASVC